MIRYLITSSWLALESNNPLLQYEVAIVGVEISWLTTPHPAHMHTQILKKFSLLEN